MVISYQLSAISKEIFKNKYLTINFFRVFIIIRDSLYGGRNPGFSPG
ncbi:Uncharacterized protein dnm_056150 [Desulfonema magnum]|uniref:Uncharacterized protein n=1 Tax=Desulfonema magnum TaxID=45655 RepID=A0A975BQX0_9BACT|nr:Uncharacterized protein dnm_056150 [Desulfonema magnum]